MTEEHVSEHRDDEVKGEVSISEDVVYTIVAKVVSECKGIVPIGGSLVEEIAQKFSKKQPPKGIKIDMKDKEVHVDLVIQIEYGYRIPDAVWELQEHVKHEVEKLTGLKVVSIDVSVESVYFPEEGNSGGDVE